jgi:hypothetical protein
MKFRLTAICTAVLLAVAQGAAHAAFTATYAFTGSSAAASVTGADGPNITALNFVDGDNTLNIDAGDGNPSPSVIKVFNDIPLTSGLNYTTTTSWVGFTVNPNAGFSLSLTNLDFDYQRDSGAPGNPTFTYSLRSSIDNYGSNLSVSTVTNNGGSFSTDLTSLALGTSGVSFRIYISTSDLRTSTTDGAHIDNVVLRGSAISQEPVIGATPEPTTLAIWGIGALGCAVAGYRRRKQAV